MADRIINTNTNNNNNNNNTRKKKNSLKQQYDLYQIPENTLEDYAKLNNSSTNNVNSTSRQGSGGSRNNVYASKLISNRYVNTASLYHNILAKRNSSISIRSGVNGNIIVNGGGNNTNTNNINNNGDVITSAYPNASLRKGVAETPTNENNEVGVNPMAQFEMKRTRSIRPQSSSAIVTEHSNSNSSSNSDNHKDNSLQPTKSGQALKSKDFEKMFNKATSLVQNNASDQLFRSNFGMDTQGKKNATVQKAAGLVLEISSSSPSKQEDEISISSSNQSPLNVYKIKTQLAESPILIERENSNNSCDYIDEDVGYPRQSHPQVTLRSQLKLTNMKSKFDLYNSSALYQQQTLSNNNSNSNSNILRQLSNNNSPLSSSVMDFIGAATTRNNLSNSDSDSNQHSRRSSLSLSEHMNFRSEKQRNFNKKNDNDNNNELPIVAINFWMVNSDLETRLLHEKINIQLNSIKRLNPKPMMKLVKKLQMSNNKLYAPSGTTSTVGNNLVVPIVSQSNSIEVPNNDHKKTRDKNNEDKNNGNEAIKAIIDDPQMIDFQEKLYSIKNTSKQNGFSNSSVANTIDIGTIKDQNLREMMERGSKVVLKLWQTTEHQLENQDEEEEEEEEEEAPEIISQN